MVLQLLAARRRTASLRAPLSSGAVTVVIRVLLGTKSVRPARREDLPQADEAGANDADGDLDEGPEVGGAGLPGLLFCVGGADNGLHAQAGGQADEEADDEDDDEADALAEGHVQAGDYWHGHHEDYEVGEEVESCPGPADGSLAG